MDVRPADGKLYGVTPDGVIVTIDVASGNWEKKSQISEKLPRVSPSRSISTLSPTACGC